MDIAGQSRKHFNSPKRDGNGPLEDLVDKPHKEVAIVIFSYGRGLVWTINTVSESTLALGSCVERRLLVMRDSGSNDVHGFVEDFLRWVSLPSQDPHILDVVEVKDSVASVDH